MSKRIDRSGETNVNTFGTPMKIIEYINNKKILVEFQDEHKYQTYTKYTSFLNGNVKNLYDKVVANVGYLGEGVGYKGNEKAYHVWHDMLSRCYDPTCSNYYNYCDCTVCEDWYNFQNFVEWFNENYYEVNNERMHLDKDILYKHNRVYSPETCVFVPISINVLFTHKKSNNDNLPVGCYYNHGKIQVVCRTGYKQHIIGRFELNDVEGAFNAYKRFKEDYIHQITESYKDNIPFNLYNAMYNYEIEIND